MRKPHSHSAARRRIAVIVQLLERRQNVIQTEPVPDPRHFTQGRLGFIRGEKKAERSDESKFVSERYYGSFERQISLEGVEEDKAQAAFKNGVLTVTLPKSEQSSRNVKRIAINTN